MMDLQARLAVLVKLGEHLDNSDEYLDALIHRTDFNNPWFTKENQELAIRSIRDHFLRADKLSTWLSGYTAQEPVEPKKVAVILAGNIPLVGFHDVLSIFISGHIAQIKLSEKDKYLLPYLIQCLEKFNPETSGYFEIVDKVADFDAVIATGSNNSARYFEAYFGKYPNIIRKNRNAIAVLNGSETTDELKALGKDVFQYFGLGCRNVSKLYLPKDYAFEPLMEALHEYREIVNHSKYKNNFDYNYAIFVINRESYKANGCIILREQEDIASHIAGLHYEFYEDTFALENILKNRQNEIQCIVANTASPLKIKTFPFGKAQEPELWDYADGVDTLEFLFQL